MKKITEYRENNFIQNLDIINPKNKESHNFTFDRIFTESDTQDEVKNKTFNFFYSQIFTEVKPFIQSALDGENICIFAYGSTGSGKTFTMQGGDEDNKMNNRKLEISQNSGLLPRSAEFIFNEISRLQNFKNKFNLFFSAVEIYNENIFDLLTKSTNNLNHNKQHTSQFNTIQNNFNIENNTSSKQKINKNSVINLNKPKKTINGNNQNYSNGNNQNYSNGNNLVINTNNNSSNITNKNILNVFSVNNEFHIKNLTWIKVQKKEDILKLAKEATEARRSDSTQFNNVSSRSHAIFQIKIDKIRPKLVLIGQKLDRNQSKLVKIRVFLIITNFQN